MRDGVYENACFMKVRALLKCVLVCFNADLRANRGDWRDPIAANAAVGEESVRTEVQFGSRSAITSAGRELRKMAINIGVRCRIVFDDAAIVSFVDVDVVGYDIDMPGPRWSRVRCACWPPY